MGLMLLVVSVLALISDSSATPASELEQAWAGGDIAQAHRVFEQAYAQAEAGPCLVSPRTAQLAYRAGLTSRHDFHYFYIADLIDQEVGGLTDTQRQVAEALQTEPGQRFEDDADFYRFLSVWTSNPGRCPDEILPALPEPASGQGETAVIVVNELWSSRRRVSETQVLDGYPRVEAESLAAGLVGRRRPKGETGWVVDQYRFSPCSRIMDSQGFWIGGCRPGFGDPRPQPDD